MNSATLPWADLHKEFGERLQTGVSLARFTAARIGGPADALLVTDSADDLARIVTALWGMGVSPVILGGGSNVLVSDAGVRNLVILNRARKMHFLLETNPPRVWAESGTNFGALARQSVSYGLAGLEWAAGIPGSLGGAIVGNAGAHGADMAGNLLVAEILHRMDQAAIGGTRERWTVEKFEYSYRSSFLKQNPGQAVVLSALLRLERSAPEAVQAKIEAFTEHRRRTQPPGASMGSMFKNPPGDYAGRLIEAAGLKGMCVGDAEISNLHANFFINKGAATADDVFSLIEMARREVAQQFNVDLELEIELIGEWDIN